MSNLIKLYQIQELINKPWFDPELNEFPSEWTEDQELTARAIEAFGTSA